MLDNGINYHSSEIICQNFFLVEVSLSRFHNTPNAYHLAVCMNDARVGSWGRDSPLKMTRVFCKDFAKSLKIFETFQVKFSCLT